jgi:uncharacterized membrane protein YfcA
MNFASNLGALLIFATSGAIDWLLGLAMGMASAAGGALGARVSLRLDARRLRLIVILVALALAFRLLLDPQHPWSGFILPKLEFIPSPVSLLR